MEPPPPPAWPPGSPSRRTTCLCSRSRTGPSRNEILALDAQTLTLRPQLSVACEPGDENGQMVVGGDELFVRDEL